MNKHFKLNYKFCIKNSVIKVSKAEFYIWNCHKLWTSHFSQMHSLNSSQTMILLLHIGQWYFTTRPQAKNRRKKTLKFEGNIILYLLSTIFFRVPTKIWLQTNKSVRIWEFKMCMFCHKKLELTQGLKPLAWLQIE